MGRSEVSGPHNGSWSPTPGQHALTTGDRVTKGGGDYTFTGEVRAVLNKRSGAVRVVVENDDGILHIFNPSQLTKEQQ